MSQLLKLIVALVKHSAQALMLIKVLLAYLSQDDLREVKTEIDSKVCEPPVTDEPEELEEVDQAANPVADAPEEAPPPEPVAKPVWKPGTKK